MILCRHFVKEDLPRIRYANPAIEIEVNKLPKAKEETWKPEMVVELSALHFRFKLILLYSHTNCM